MIPLHRELQFTFRFAEDRIIPRFHIEGVATGTCVSIFRFETTANEHGLLLATALVGDGGWVDLPEPIVVRAGEGFVVLPEETT